MKKQILKILHLEVQDLREKVHDHYVTAMKHLAAAEHLASDEPTTTDYHSKVSVLFEAENNFFENIDLGYDVFCERYKTKHGLELFPQPSGTKEDATKLLHKSQELKRLIQGTIVTPISSYLQREKETVIHIALTKFKKELALDDKSAETQELMDLDPPTDAGTVKSLIAEETRKATQKLRAELGQLKKKLEEKVKESRGQAASASEKKEKERLKKLKKAQASRKGKADESETATSVEKGKKQRKRKGKKQKKNQRK